VTCIYWHLCHELYVLYSSHQYSIYAHSTCSSWHRLLETRFYCHLCHELYVLYTSHQQSMSRIICIMCFLPQSLRHIDEACLWVAHERSHELSEAPTIWITNNLCHELNVCCQISPRHIDEACLWVAHNTSYQQSESRTIWVTNWMCFLCLWVAHNTSHQLYKARTLWVANSLSHELYVSVIEFPTMWVAKYIWLSSLWVAHNTSHELSMSRTIYITNYRSHELHATIISMSCTQYDLHPIVDRLAQHLEITSKNVQFSTRRTRILMWLSCVTGTNRKSHWQNSSSLEKFEK